MRKNKEQEKDYKELYEQLLKDYNDEMKENKFLQGEIECLNNYKHKIDMECNKQFGKIHDLNERLNQLECDYNILKKYTKHIQEYLCKDIFELMKKEYGDSYEE